MERKEITMKKKTYILACMLFFVAMLAAACGKKEPEKEPELEPGKETELAPKTPLSGFSLFQGRFTHEIAWCEKGMLTVDYPEGEDSGQRNMLYFTEFGTGQKYLLCSDAYCAHEPASITNPDPVCEATMEEITNACIYGSNLYILQMNGMENMILWARDLTKKGYRKLADLPYTYGMMYTGYHAVAGTKMYYFAGKIDKGVIEASGGYTNRDSKTVLLEVDLTTGKYKELMDFDIGDERYRVLRTIYEKEGVFVFCYMEDSYDSYENGNFEYTLLDYKEKFFYIPHDGSKPTECYEDILTERCRAFIAKDIEWSYALMAWGADGCYLVPKEGDRVVLDRFPDRKREVIYTIGEDEQEIGDLGISGDILLIGILKKSEEKELLCVNLKDGSQKRMEYDYKYFGQYIPIADGIFTSGSRYSQENLLKVYDWNGLEKKVIFDMEQ